MKIARRSVLTLATGLALLIGAASSASAATPEDLSPNCSFLSDTVVKADGSIVAVGSECGPEGKTGVIKVRPDGTLDPGFSDGGARIFPDTAGDSVVELAEAQNGNTILVTETSIYEFRPDGSPEPNFAQGGQRVGIPGSLLGGRRIIAAGVQPDGRIVVTSSGKEGLVFLARFEVNGELDDTFGVDGVKESELGGLVIGFDGSGRILLGGYGAGGASAARLLENGDPDPTFGPDGDGFSDPFVPEDLGFDRLGLVSGIVVTPDGSFRIYGETQEYMYSKGNIGYFFNEDGLPAGPDNHGDRLLGGMGIIEEGAGKYFSTNLTSFGPDRNGYPAFNVMAGKGEPPFSYISQTKLPVAPKYAYVRSIEYSAAQDSLILAGQATGYDSTGSRESRWSGMVIAKVDARTGDPDPTFGVGGAAIFPANRCDNGHPAGSIDPKTPWNRCRLTPPRSEGRVAIQFGASRRPAVKGRIDLSGATFPPAGSKLEVKLPDRLKLKRGMGKAKVFGSVSPATTPPVTVAFKKRTIVISTARPQYGDNRFYEPPLANVPETITFGLKRGALKPIPRKLRRKNLNFRVTGTNLAPVSTFPEAPNAGTLKLQWYSDNGKSGIFKARAVKPRGR